MLSFSKLLRRRLKLTDQAQWMMSVISEVRVVYVVGFRPRVGSERSDGRAMSLFREAPGSELHTRRLRIDLRRRSSASIGEFARTRQ